MGLECVFGCCVLVNYYLIDMKTEKAVAERYDLFENVIVKIRYESHTRATQHAQLARVVAAERERIRGHFREALSDKGITWPGEVDILYDQCFSAPWTPIEDK